MSRRPLTVGPPVGADDPQVPMPVEDAAATLRGGGSLALPWPRRTGKSSFVRRLVQDLVAVDNVVHHRVEEDRGAFLVRALGAGSGRRLVHGVIPFGRDDETDTLQAAFFAAVEAWVAAGPPPIVVLDEWNRLQGRAVDGLLRLLRRLERADGLRLVLAGAASFEDFGQTVGEARRWFRVLETPSWNADDVTGLLKAAGWAGADSAIAAEATLPATCGHPYLTTCLLRGLEQVPEGAPKVRVDDEVAKGVAILLGRPTADFAFASDGDDLFSKTELELRLRFPPTRPDARLEMVEWLEHLDANEEWSGTLSPPVAKVLGATNGNVSEAPRFDTTEEVARGLRNAGVLRGSVFANPMMRAFFDTRWRASQATAFTHTWPARASFIQTGLITDGVEEFLRAEPATTAASLLSAADVQRRLMDQRRTRTMRLAVITTVGLFFVVVAATTRLYLLQSAYDALRPKYEKERNQLKDELQTALKDAKLQLIDAKLQLNDANTQLNDAKLQLNDANIQLNDANIQLNDANTQLNDAKLQLKDTRTQLDKANMALTTTKAELSPVTKRLKDATAELESTLQMLADTNKKEVDLINNLADARTKNSKLEGERNECLEKLTKAGSAVKECFRPGDPGWGDTEEEECVVRKLKGEKPEGPNATGGVDGTTTSP